MFNKELKIFEFYNEQLIKYRKEKNLSQEELADKIGVSRQTIYAWESGKSIPDMENVVNICNILEITVDKLANGLKIDTENITKRKTKKKIKSIVLKILIVILVIYILISIYKGFVINKISNNSSNYEKVSNYHYNVTHYESDGTRSYDFYTEDVYFKDGIMKSIYKDNENYAITWIDYNKKIGYIFDENKHVAEKINLENTIHPDESQLTSLSPFVIEKNVLTNYIVSFIPFYSVSMKNDVYTIKHKIKIGSYKGNVEEKIDKNTGLPISSIEYGNNGINTYKFFTIKTDETTEEDLKMPDLENYEIR